MGFSTIETFTKKMFSCWNDDLNSILINPLETYSNALFKYIVQSLRTTNSWKYFYNLKNPIAKNVPMIKK